MMVRIRSAIAVGELKVQLELTDGSRVEKDLGPLLEGRIFDSIRTEPDIFRQVSVTDGTLAWPNGIDLDPDMVIWGGPPPLDARERTG